MWRMKASCYHYLFLWFPEDVKRDFAHSCHRRTWLKGTCGYWSTILYASCLLGSPKSCPTKMGDSCPCSCLCQRAYVTHNSHRHVRISVLVAQPQNSPVVLGRLLHFSHTLYIRGDFSNPIMEWKWKDSQEWIHDRHLTKSTNSDVENYRLFNEVSASQDPANRWVLEDLRVFEHHECMVWLIDTLLSHVTIFLFCKPYMRCAKSRHV